MTRPNPAPADAIPDTDWAKVTGRAAFTADVPCESALHAAFALSTEPHARIVGVDISRAEAVPGVAAVITGADIGDRRFGRSLRDYPALAVDRVLFTGQRVAAVAAADAQTARLAAGLVAIEYEPLETILGLEEALHGGDVELHPDYDAYEGAWDDRPRGNLQGGDSIVEGDVDAAFAACDALYEHTFAWSRSHAAPLEPHACLVDASGDQAHVYSAHKEPYKLRRYLAGIIGRPEEDFVVHHVHIGGDFGAKGAVLVEVACYYLSRRTGRPVRTSMSYFEELTSTSARHPGAVRLRTGVRDGRTHAHEAEALLDGGAFAGLKPQPTRVVGFPGLPLAPYDLAHRDERVAAVYTNALPGGQVRAPGEFPALFAGESHIDMIARARGEDPVEFRLRNTSVPETRRVLAELREVVGRWRADLAGGGGLGVSVFDRSAGSGETAVSCEATTSGVTLEVGTPDQGAGMYAAFRALAARALEVPAASVSVKPVGARPGLTDAGAGGSRVTAVAGRACVEACRALLADIGCPPADRPDGYWIGQRLEELGRTTVAATGAWRATRGVDGHSKPSYGGLVVEVSVDVETGGISVRRAALVIDTGQVVNPVGHRGQIEGGFVFGLSQTLFEDLKVADGQVVTASLGDYKLACAGDIPPLDVTILPNEPADDPFEDIRAIGELAHLGVAPAIANAIDDAVGVRVRELPITAERVWRALRA